MLQIGAKSPFLFHPIDSRRYHSVIDDALPVSPNGDVLSLSTGSGNALWPRLLEKAVSFFGLAHGLN